MDGANYAMSWTQARDYALAVPGRRIRRVGWSDRWLFPAGHLWWGETIATGESHVVAASEFGPGEFAAVDWTNIWPDQQVCVFPAPYIVLSVTPPGITRGETALLEWQVDNATFVTLNGEAVEAAYGRRVSPLSSTTYTLAAEGLGGSATQSVTLAVDVPPKPVPPYIPPPPRLDPTTLHIEARTPYQFGTSNQTQSRQIDNPFDSVVRVSFTGVVQRTVRVKVGRFGSRLVFAPNNPPFVVVTGSFLLPERSSLDGFFTIQAYADQPGPLSYDLDLTFNP